ncbi:serine hydrolase [Chitinophaga sp. Mgbs1]|uniref:Serine hydrolase n=1 Tax=Chitinophaga solisilvae TaxID=1233460 RepID=A0A9Q5D6V2_9BACT|nr:serine hydrolase [Chitinophaga solisilvae]
MKWLSPLLLSCLLHASVYAQQDKAARIDKMIRTAARTGAFNGDVLVADHDTVIYKAAAGVADSARRIPLTIRHRFHIGSIAKEFNAVAIMMLQQQGKLQLEDKVAQYIPGLPAWAQQVNILQLLQYTSGLPDLNWTTIQSDADIMEDLKKLTALKFEPGTDYFYSNNNVFLQRRIVEKVTGVSFNDFVRQQILQPLGMRASLVDPDGSDTLVARGFNDAGQQEPLLYPISGWVTVTPDDFLQWSESLNHFRLLTPASTSIIMQSTGPGRQASLGRGTIEQDKIIHHMHDGSTRCYQALLVSDPPKGRTVLLLSNNKQDNIYEFNNAIQNILDNKPYIQPKKTATRLFMAALDTLSQKQFFAYYHQQKKLHQDTHDFESEFLLNGIGYYLLRKGRTDDAIAVFLYNTRLFPHSANVFDSLGEAYYHKGDKANALKYYQQSLALDPNNPAAQKTVNQLVK